MEIFAESLGRVRRRIKKVTPRSFEGFLDQREADCMGGAVGCCELNEVASWKVKSKGR